MAPAWLQQDGDRAVLRDFLLDFLNILPETRATPDAMKAMGLVLATDKRF